MSFANEKIIIKQLDFRPKSKNHPFDCGNSDLNEYLLRYAWSNHNKGYAKVYIAVNPTKASRNILGYYAISAAALNIDALPESLRKGQPKQVPCVKIGRLANAIAVRGKGIGRKLLFHALYQTVEISKMVGVSGVTADAKIESIGFYEKYGFLRLEDSNSFFLPIETIKQGFEKS
ncbi:GCN5-related N-acetyltransferase [Thalassoporum mexicanum PCC 7367]|uniref:GNAT family N-acetyltransferase n=1 Tax=Thalassoporum mexicanum TaxID=3457544 RepID=UPI00029FE9BE|nr:GNAT family N-acetyltransferase [Pseudanabaena sp. PCC 7367]AFY69649.1 GCN5-related N-acetyltransferase [Pseudanabaena sp. PCC 7367]